MYKVDLDLNDKAAESTTDTARQEGGAAAEGSAAAPAASATDDTGENGIGEPAAATSTAPAAAAAEDTKIIIDPKDLLAKAKEFAGRDIDEDELKTPYKEKYNLLKELEEDLNDEELKSFRAFKKKGGNAKDFFEASSIDPAAVPELDLLYKDLAERYKTTDKRILDRKYKQDFGDEAELAQLKESQDDEDYERAHDLELKRKETVEAQRQKLIDRKVALATPPNTKTQKEIETENEVKHTNFRNEFLNEVSKVEKMKIAEYEHVVDKTVFAEVANAIQFSEKLQNGRPLTVIEGIEPAELQRLMYQDKALPKIIGKIKTDAETAAALRYNHEGGPAGVDKKDELSDFTMTVNGGR